MQAAISILGAVVIVLAPWQVGAQPGPPFNGCGTLVSGVDCPVLFRADTGQTFVVDNLDGFHAGDRVRVTGIQDPTCVTACLVSCIRDNTITSCPAQPTGFTCYRATGAAPRDQVDLSDRFEEENGAMVLLPEMHCVPVNTDGQPIGGIESLTCYRTYPPARQQKFTRTNVPVVNDLDSQSLDVYNRANLLCVPSSAPPE